MYLWNTKALAKELKEGTLSEWDKFKYYIIGVLLYSLIGDLSYISNTDFTYTYFDILISFISLFIIFLGVYKSYEVNNMGDGKNFLERFICLSLPVGIRILVLSVLVILILTIISAMVYGIEESQSDKSILYDKTFIYSIVFILYTLFYWRVYIHMKWISHNNTDIINS